MRRPTATAESVRGWLAAGVLPTVKHFPGLGGATVNTDDGSATIDRTRGELDEDLEPFRAALDAGATLVMASHAVYPALDGERIASQSPAVIDGLLRGELGFQGVVMTDSLEAAAVRAVADVDEAALASARAGVDVMLTTGRGSYIRVFRALLGEARRSPQFRERVRASAARVLEARGSADASAGRTALGRAAREWDGSYVRTAPDRGPPSHIPPPDGELCANRARSGTAVAHSSPPPPYPAAVRAATALRPARAPSAGRGGRAGRAPRGAA